MIKPVPDASRPTDDESAQKLEALIQLARTDLMCFVELVFDVLHPGDPLIYADYLGLLASLLMRVERGKYQRVIVNMPPRHMKSMMVSVFYVAWRLGRDPTAKFITISYGDDLAHDLSALTRTLMMSKKYRAIFPGTILDKKAVDYVRTTKGGYRYATSIGSDITGFGADEIIVDDPMQPDDAASEHVKERIRRWFDSSVERRFNNSAHEVLILVMHRLAPDDLSATLSEHADIVLKLPLVAEKVEKYKALEKLIFYRKPGDVLNPARMTAEKAAKLKARTPPYVWNSQYQQRPTAGGSGRLSIDRFQRYDLNKPPPFELTIHSWDIGATINGNASVCTKWGLYRNNQGRDFLYLLQIIRLKAELPEVRAAIKAEDRRDRPALIVLDERGVGLGVYQELRKEGYRNIKGSSETSERIELGTSAESRPSKTKIERFGKAILRIDDGSVFIPHEAPGLEAFLYETSAFPNIADKDQVDSMTQLIGNWDNGLRFARQNKSNEAYLRP
jgi:predicted phage terminase large subunit-like protein